LRDVAAKVKYRSTEIDPTGRISYFPGEEGAHRTALNNADEMKQKEKQMYDDADNDGDGTTNKNDPDPNNPEVSGVKDANKPSMSMPRSSGGGKASTGGVNQTSQVKTVSENLSFDSRKVQHEYGRGHAANYGVNGNWNKANGATFEQAMRNQINSVNDPILGTFKGTIQVYHFYDPKTGLDTMIDTSGNFVAGWKLSADQIKCLLQNGNVQ